MNKTSLASYRMSKTLQNIEFIQEKLNKLYFPLKIMLYEYNEIDKTKVKSKDFTSKMREDLPKIILYSSLASDDLTEPLEAFINIFYKNIAVKMNECRKKLEELKNTVNETEAENLVIDEFQLNDSWSGIRNEIWSTPTDKEAEDAIQLYLSILEIIEADILKFNKDIEDLKKQI